MKTIVGFGLLLGLAISCRTVPNQDVTALSAKNSLRESGRDGFVSDEDRMTYLKEGRIFVGDESYFPSVDELLDGPKTKKNRILANQVNYCHYFKRRNGGTNPKFRCYLADAEKNYLTTKGKVVPFDLVHKVDSKQRLRDRAGNDLGKADEIKVKYFPSKSARDLVRIYRRNPFGRYLDRYTEAVSTRIMWAMGFAADLMWPTSEVRCFGCPIEPYHRPTRDIRDVVIFPDAAVERKFKGKKIESKTTRKGQGFSWKEMKAISDNYWRGTKKQDEFEALLITITLMNHVSNRPEQQRLVCKKGSIDENGVCQKTTLIVQDIGSTFGHRTITYSNGRRHKSKSKGSVKNWSAQKIWKDENQCTLNMMFYYDDSSKYLTFDVSKGGLEFAQSRLRQLTRDHVYALFKYAKLDRADKDLKDKLTAEFGSSDISEAALKIWTDAFMAKVDQILTADCPE